MYKILGVDGNEYGPASLEQLKQWIAEGRVNAQTRIQTPGSGDWKLAGEVPEVNSLFAASGLPGRTAIPPLPPVQPGARPPQQGLALTSFVLGILSFVLCLLLLTGIPAIICGHVAYGRTRRSPAQFGGAGLAIAGLTLGYLSVLFTLLILALSLSAFAQRKGNAQATLCASQMRQIGLAFRLWSMDHGDQFPFNVSTNNAGSQELCAPTSDGFDRNTPRHLATLAQELGTAKILICPQDASKHPALDFQSLSSSNVSYRLRTGLALSKTNGTEVLLECPLHGTRLLCDGSIEMASPPRKSGRNR
jgi:hypothetical protein